MSLEATLTQSQQDLLNIIRAQNAEHVSGAERKKAPFKTAVKDIFDVVGYTANTVSNVMAVASDKSFSMRQESRIDTMMSLESKEEEYLTQILLRNARNKAIIEAGGAQ